MERIRFKHLTTRMRRRRCLLITVWAVVFVASFVYRPEFGLVICPFRRFWGIPCPGCGLTRSFAAFAHGCWADAFRFHLLGPAFYVIGILMFGRAVYELWRGYEVAMVIHHRNFILTVLLMIVLIAWLVKLGVLYHSGDIVLAWRDGFVYKFIQTSCFLY